MVQSKPRWSTSNSIGSQSCASGLAGQAFDPRGLSGDFLWLATGFRPQPRQRMTRNAEWAIRRVKDSTPQWGKTHVEIPQSPFLIAGTGIMGGAGRNLQAFGAVLDSELASRLVGDYLRPGELRERRPRLGPRSIAHNGQDRNRDVRRRGASATRLCHPRAPGRRLVPPSVANQSIIQELFQ